MALVYISLGSNLGARAVNLASGLEALSEIAAVLRTSSLYETEPVGIENQPGFLNSAALIETALEPPALLRELQGIELRHGRARGGEPGPRTLDLDIIFYDDLVLSTPGLVVPHPRAHERRFVLEPLCELDPGLVHPLLGLTVRELLDGLGEGQWVRRL